MDYDSDLARRIAASQIEFYRRLRPGEPPSLENARTLMKTLFFDPRRYDLGRVGRYKLNRRLGLPNPPQEHVLTMDDLVEVIRTIIKLNRGEDHPDDIDHLGNRRVRAVGELVQNQVRVGLLRMERMVKEKMTLVDPEIAAPQGLVNIRPVVASVREFFGGSQLSQFMDQTNPLAELTHKRRLSALGPGGLSRERAGFDVRDVHFSHYGRICPIETPEGPNIGLLSSLASYARTNPYGFIESPYRPVLKELPCTARDLGGRTVTEAVLDESGKTIVAKGKPIPKNRVARINQLPAGTTIHVRPFVAGGEDDVLYLSADQEENYHVAQANSLLDEMNQFVNDRVEVRVGENYIEESPDVVDMMDVSPMQIMSISAALIPFLEHDDANPGPDGFQHAAAGRAPAPAPGSPGGHRHRRPGGQGQRTGPAGPGRRGYHLGNGTGCNGHRHGRRGTRPPLDQVLPHQPGDLLRPASDGTQGGRGGKRGRPGGQFLHRPRGTGAGTERPGGIHVLGGLQLRGCHHPE